MSESIPPAFPITPVVLLLEDNEAYRNLMAEVLTLAGFEVCAVPDGRRVADILNRRAIDLVITDVVMPERDGLETITALRYSHPRLPVIAISGDMPINTHLYLTLAEKLGAARILAKPFPMRELVAAARDALVDSAKRAEAGLE